MSNNYYAKVLDGIVVDMKRATPEFMESFVDSSPGRWIQTSYNTFAGQHTEEGGTPLRGNFAGIGFEYHANLDAFVEPRPWVSWTLNTTTYQWEPPVAKPTDGGIYDWNEDAQSWDAVETE